MKFILTHENISEILRSPAMAGQALSPRTGVVIANSCQALKGRYSTWQKV
jgi:hypothetical protein